jgi:hypothetical protein
MPHLAADSVRKTSNLGHTTARGHPRQSEAEQAAARSWRLRFQFQCKSSVMIGDDICCLTNSASTILLHPMVPHVRD